MTVKYDRLEKEFERLISLPIEDSFSNEASYSLLCALEMGNENYEFIKEFCKKNGITKVTDIGCAHGFQSEVFIDSDIRYRGIEISGCGYWNNDQFEYIQSEYPCNLETEQNELAVSVLCLGWNCFLFDGKETLKAQFKSLSKQFKQALIYMQSDFFGEVSGYFNTAYKVAGNFYYFSN